MLPPSEKEIREVNEESLTLVVPVLDEEGALGAFLPELTEYCALNCFRLVFVDDGSNDGSAALLETFCDEGQIRLLRHKVNRGYGAAIKRGIAASDTDFVVTFDAGGQHRPEDVGKLFECAIRNNADMVVGRRQSGYSGIYRAIGAEIDPAHCGPARFHADFRPELWYEKVSAL